MPIEVTCPNSTCARRYSITEAALGRTVRCKGCGESFVASPTETHQSDAGRTRPSPNPPAAPVEITGVGRFEIRGKLGAGAFGTVYRAYDPQLDRDVALKVPKPGSLDSSQRVERFLREAKAAARLRHPHIVPVFDAGKDGDHYYIASAFIDGKPLADSIGETGTGFRRAARLARELAEALAYAHGEGVVHRDVKPQNAMVDANDRLHLMDFGLAVRAADSGEEKLTKDGTVMGTPAYMPPEQARGKSGEAKPAADQYAVGVVLYELLTGEVPFRGPIAVVLHNVIHTEPAKPSGLRPDVPRDLETICLKAMSKRPKDRYANCQELADDLRRWFEGEPIAARRLGPVERAARWARKNPAIAGSVTFAFLALSLGFAVAVWQMSAARAAEQREGQQRGIAEGNEKEARRQEGIAREKESLATRAFADLTAETEKTKKAQEAKEAALLAKIAQSRMAAHRSALLAARDYALQGDFARARESLSGCPLGTRGWEWHYLAAAVRRWEKEQPGQPAFEPGAATAGPKDAAVRMFQYAPAAKRLVGFCGDRTVRVWDAASGEEKDSFAPEAPIGQLPTVPAPIGVSPDGRFVALPLYLPRQSPRVGIWDVPGRKLVRVHQLAEDVDLTKPPPAGIIAYPDPVALEFSPDGRWLACAKSANLTIKEPGGRVVIWDSATGKERCTLAVDNWDVVCLAFSPDGRRLAGGTSNMTKSVVLGGGYATSKVHVWDLDASPRSAATFPLAAGATSITFSPDGRFVACGDHYVERVVVADAGTGESRFVGSGPAFAVAFTPDGSRLIGMALGQPGQAPVPGPKEQVRLKSWDVATGQELFEFASSYQSNSDAKLPQNFAVRPRLAAIPGQEGVRVAFQDGGGIRAFEAPRVSEPFTLERGVDRLAFRQAPRGNSMKPIRVAAFSPDDAWVALATSGESNQINPLSPNRPRNPGAPVGNLFSEQANVQTLLQVWDAADGRLVTAFNGPRDPVVRVAVSPGGEWVAVLTRRAVGAPKGPVGVPGKGAGGGAPKGPLAIRTEVSLWDVKRQVVARTWNDVPVKQPAALGFRADSSHLSLVGNDGSATWRISDGVAVEGVRFEASEIDVRRVWKSNAGDVFSLPNPKQLPGSVLGAVNSDGRRRVRVLEDGTVLVDELHGG